MRCGAYKFHSQPRSRFPLFCTSGTLHTRHIRVIFEFWGRPFCSSLLVSFFWCCYERNSIHTASLSHFISRSLGSPPVLFYPAVYDCWIHVNNSMPLVVSLNDESWLAHRRQLSVGSAFQFHYRKLLFSFTLDTIHYDLFTLPLQFFSTLVQHKNFAVSFIAYGCAVSP